jgi:hypothetical protein
VRHNPDKIKLYIATPMDASLSRRGERPDNISLDHRMSRRYEDLYRLGIMLIELWCQIPKDVEKNANRPSKIPEMLTLISIGVDDYLAVSHACSELLEECGWLDLR